MSFGIMELVILASLLALAAMPILGIALFVASRASARQREADAR